MNTSATTMSSGEWLMLASLSVLWGGSFFLVCITLKALQLFTIVVLRVGIASLSTALTYFSYFRILSSAGATIVLLVTLLIPVSSIMLRTTFLDEHFAMQHAVGMTLISISLLTIDGRSIKWITKQTVSQVNT